MATTNSSPTGAREQRSLAGRVAIVTGASRGIGLAVANLLLRRGASVCITARTPDTLAEAATHLEGEDRLLTVAGNASDPAHRAIAVDATVARFGAVDYLVNNAGINPVYGPLLEIELDALRKTFDTNVAASLGWIQEVHSGGIAERAGAIVNIASIAGLHAAPMVGAYGASKAALIHLTQQLALELAPGVRINAVAPAVVRTRFASALYEGREASVVARYPLGRLGAPDDVAEAVLFLLSDSADWITGQTLVLDGGLTLTTSQEDEIG